MRIPTRTSLVALLVAAGCATSPDPTKPSASSAEGGAGGATSSTEIGGASSDNVGFGGGGNTGPGSMPFAGTVCDDGIDLEDIDPKNAARALELCDVVTQSDDAPGLLDAKWVRADGSDAAPTPQFGIQASFGPNVGPQGGHRMLVLSSGFARTPGQPDECGTFCCSGTGEGTPPPHFPDNKPGCSSDWPAENLTTIYDDIGLEVKLRAPKDATGYRFAFKFYSFEFPEYVCSPYNDEFVALVEPAPADSKFGNISFDKNGNFIGVNLAFFDGCDASQVARYASKCVPEINSCPVPPSPYCPQSTKDLEGTGFDGAWDIHPAWQGDGDAGATAWLQSTAPVEGGTEVTIRFAIWDKGDENYDATVLIDHFEWLGGDVGVDTDPVPK